LNEFNIVFEEAKTSIAHKAEEKKSVTSFLI